MGTERIGHEVACYHKWTQFSGVSTNTRNWSHFILVWNPAVDYPIARCDTLLLSNCY